MVNKIGLGQFHFSVVRYCHEESEHVENSPITSDTGSSAFSLHDKQADDLEELSSGLPSQRSHIDEKLLSRTIYILGVGNIGKFVAHSLARIPGRPSITLLLHRRTLLESFERNGKKIELIKNDIPEYSTGYEAELALPRNGSRQTEVSSKCIIYNLIISVKAPHTIAALSNIADRLTRDSTIVFLQNGMGIIDEVNAKVFPNTKTRPSYLQGIITHGLYRRGDYGVTHAGLGTLALGPVLHRSGELNNMEERADSTIAPSSRYILRTLTRTPALAAVGFGPMDLMQQQVEKVAINAIINPLTVMFDCLNGELLGNFAITRVMRLLLSESSLVIRSLPELQHVPNVQARFSPQRLEALVTRIARATSSNLSSTLQDVRTGEQTEIEYINGYIVRRGEELGIRCVMNYMLEKMVIGKQQMNYRKRLGLLPILE